MPFDRPVAKTLAIHLSFSVVHINVYKVKWPISTNINLTPWDRTLNLVMILTCWVRDSGPVLTPHAQSSLRRRTRRRHCCTAVRTPGGRSGGPGNQWAACGGVGPGDLHARSLYPGHSPGRNPGPDHNLCRGRSRDPAGRSLVHVGRSLGLFKIIKEIKS